MTIQAAITRIVGTLPSNHLDQPEYVDKWVETILLTLKELMEK